MGGLKTNVVIVINKGIIMLLVHQISVKRKKRMMNKILIGKSLLSWLALAESYIRVRVRELV
jgi:hypothetical protein